MTAKVTEPVHIEKKVIVGTALGLAATIGVEILNDESLLSSLPANLQPFVRVFAGPVGFALGGYLARHSFRAELQTLETEAAAQVGLHYFPTVPPVESGAVTVADPST